MLNPSGDATRANEHSGGIGFRPDQSGLVCCDHACASKHLRLWLERLQSGDEAAPDDWKAFRNLQVSPKERGVQWGNRQVQESPLGLLERVFG